MTSIYIVEQVLAQASHLISTRRDLFFITDRGALWQAGYPCSGCGSTCGIYTAASGTLSDGSGSGYYPNQAVCKWIIAPVGASTITITLTELSTESCCDFVTVSACFDVNCQSRQQLTRQSGSLSTQQSFTTTSGFAMVEFTTDGSVVGGGFAASWTSLSTPTLVSPPIIVFDCNAHSNMEFSAPLWILACTAPAKALTWPSQIVKTSWL